MSHAHKDDSFSRLDYVSVRGSQISIITSCLCAQLRKLFLFASKRKFSFCFLSFGCVLNHEYLLLTGFAVITFNYFYFPESSFLSSEQNYIGFFNNDHCFYLEHFVNFEQRQANDTFVIFPLFL